MLLRFVRPEDEGDIHLVVADPTTGGTMIVELPSAACTTRARLHRKINDAHRVLVAACGPVTSQGRVVHGRGVVTGIGFFDFLHGQRGVAPNGIELHPVTSFQGTCT